MASWWPKKTVAPLKNELSDPLDGSGGGNFPTSNKITDNKIRWPFFTWRVLLWKVKSWHFKEQRCRNFKCSFVSKSASDKAQMSGIYLHFLRLFLNKWAVPSKLLIFEKKKFFFTIFVQAFDWTRIGAIVTVKLGYAGGKNQIRSLTLLCSVQTVSDYFVILWIYFWLFT